MNKQQFLGASLHTGLKVKNVNGETILNVLGFDVFGDVTTQLGKTPIQFISIILRPLSDLTKPITHNGETFIPIVELAKIAFPSDVYNISESNCIITSEMMNNKPYNYMACFKTPHFMDDKQLTTLVIYPNDLHFQHRQFVHGRECTHPVHNILNIILKLIEWHFNLMDESEPFTPVTNEFNPYK